MKISLIIMTFLLVSCGEASENEIYAKNPEKSFYEYISTLRLPANLNFCGERIPLEIPEVRERAEREFYLLLQQPGQIILYLKRAGKYFPTYERVIRESNMPEDIKYLSVAESALYMARSPKDAYGLWQFIPSTGKSMGLQIDENVDERAHVEKSTRAAMRYLKEGYEKHGSWVLTAAGYNMGHGNVSGSLNFQTADNFFDLYLNDETSRYIFRIVIIKEIMTNASKYGFNLAANQIYKPERTKTVKWGASIPNLTDWAKQQNTTYKDVKILNPWILGRSLPQPSKGKYYEIEIPEK